MSSSNSITIRRLWLALPLPGYPEERVVFGVYIGDTVLFYCIRSSSTDLVRAYHYLPPDYKFPKNDPIEVHRAEGYSDVDIVLAILYNPNKTPEEMKIIQDTKMLANL